MNDETRYILSDAARGLDVPTRRLFLRNALGLGALAMLSGCDVVDGLSAERVLGAMSTTARRPGCSTPIRSRANIPRG
jgi:hypothetical protein